MGNVLNEAMQIVGYVFSTAIVAYCAVGAVWIGYFMFKERERTNWRFWRSRNAKEVERG